MLWLAAVGLVAQQESFFITTVAGSGNRGFMGDGGPATSARLQDPYGVAIDAVGNLYIADYSNYRIRKVTALGVITTVAGGGNSGAMGDGGPATAASLSRPTGVVIDTLGNLYIADTQLNRIRKVTIAGIITTAAGRGGGDCTFGPANIGFSGDGGPATEAQLGCPTGVAVDVSGNLYFADVGNNRIRKVTTDGVITTFAGSGPSNSPGGFAGDGGPATAAQLSSPRSVAVDESGNIYIADFWNNRIRKVTPAGIITTLAGSGPPVGPSATGGFGGDGGPPTSALLAGPTAVAVDVYRNVYFSDLRNNRVRKVTPAGIISTVVGSGDQGNCVQNNFGGDGGPASAAKISCPQGLGIDRFGAVYVADTLNSRIRKLSGAPSMAADGIVNAAGGLSGRVSPGQWVTIYGRGLGPSMPATSGSLARGLGGTNVFFNGIEAYTTYASANQINAIAPYGLVGSQAEVFVEFNGFAGNRVSLPLVNAFPGIFTMNRSGTGPAVVVNQNGILNSPANPAPRGSVISFWATGQGQTVPPGLDGSQPQSPEYPIPVLPVSVSMGGVTVTGSDILFSGLVYAGVMQVNVRVPERVVPGDLVELLVMVGGSTSRQGATLPAVTLSVQ